MTPTQYAAKLRRHRMRHAQRKAAGQCPRCAAAPPPGYVYCADCRRDSSRARGSRDYSPHAMIAWQGELALAATWARRYGLRPELLRYRLRRGVDFATAVTMPVKVYRPRKKKPDASDAPLPDDHRRAYAAQ